MPISEAEARQKLQALLDDYDLLTPDQRRAMSEADVVHHFIERLFVDVLGWPKDPAHYRFELSTEAGRPDITLIPERGGAVFAEGKRFGLIKELPEARFTTAGVITPDKMALPAGMATDRTPEEQQAINYAFANDGQWAILTNFEKLRLFNARRDWLVLSFERPYAYLTEFDDLWRLAYHNVLNGSLDALSNMRYARDIDTQYLSFINEWRQTLAQDLIQRAAENPWLFNLDGTLNLALLRAVVQRFLDRLVIIRFAEDHLVIEAGTLQRFLETSKAPYSPSLDELLDHVFRGFDKDHNSALFSEGPADQASFSDPALQRLLEKLYEVRYRAMPADIIGNTYEQYLGKTLALADGSVATRDNLETRKKQGSYYTPQVIVRYLVDNSLGRYLYGTQNGRPDTPPPGVGRLGRPKVSKADHSDQKKRWRGGTTLTPGPSP